jgi:chromosome segregation ATPase
MVGFHCKLTATHTHTHTHTYLQSRLDHLLRRCAVLEARLESAEAERDGLRAQMDTVTAERDQLGDRVAQLEALVRSDIRSGDTRSASPPSEAEDTAPAGRGDEKSVRMATPPKP